MKKILVPTDASESSRRALKTALEFARKFDAEVELMFVMHQPITYDSSLNMYIISPEQIEQEGKFVLDATLTKVDTSGVPLKKKIMEGNAVKVILKEIQDEDIDLVIMGRCGYGAIVDCLLGSVSQRVLYGAKCSVLITK
ncbi:universal stress protein [Desulfosporosinus sp. PR]|uniref:universal stress protein n=1 Tax=Candidatus Desulfosporosinus nitrosoreducens TaxID=3401928 RepID=UPI0027FCFCB1|nr:universal stress protein [Desulfosporosinus sp. PR]MDQ7094253.1 universal stress protein [Desulfosporosinus sp. PR]